MPSNIRVFLDVAIGNKTGGRIVFELFDDVAPLAVENFRGLCTGEYGNAKSSHLPLSYKGCKFFKVVPGFVVQSGDFECNNGDGGESIYGGTFKDENFLRRHAQAGVLSMANKGFHTNSSQFFVTLKRAPQLDGKHVAFGQVVQGMEILRAIEKCPVDGSNVPRVAIQITDCGELPKLPAVRRNDPKVQMRDAISLLMGTLEPSKPDEKKVTDAQIGALKIQQAALAPVIKEQTNKQPPKMLEEREEGSEESDVEEHLPKRRRVEESNTQEVLDLQDSRQKKLHELRQRLNQSRNLNAKEVAEEMKEQRQRDPTVKYFMNKRKLKQSIIDFDKAALSSEVVEDEEDQEEQCDSPNQRKKKKNEQTKDHSGRTYLNETAEDIQWKDDRLKKKKSNAKKAFGWDAFNTDSFYRAHKKRTQDLRLDNAAYGQQMLQLGAHFYDPTSALVSAEFRPTEDAKERLAQEVEKQSQKRKTFSRRRMYIEDENVGHINEYNRTFNRQLERAYGAQAMEIKAALERGTAL
ncbi:uncharacterized protein LOC129617285 [Condylostylus longicornis]|uniref:uncharacterized protein LOC129617285 n=1 Tax=Condylostylus longicornis TaxID=2530218 RepID=UPI00244DAEFC|nr:uncharacterized protein LOC129617285 [Condylostylus longicornis]